MNWQCPSCLLMFPALLHMLFRMTHALTQVVVSWLAHCIACCRGWRLHRPCPLDSWIHQQLGALWCRCRHLRECFHIKILQHRNSAGPIRCEMMWNHVKPDLPRKLVFHIFKHGSMSNFVIFGFAVRRSAAKVSPAELTKILSERIANFKAAQWPRLKSSIALRQIGNFKKNAEFAWTFHGCWRNAFQTYFIESQLNSSWCWLQTSLTASHGSAAILEML